MVKFGVLRCCARVISLIYIYIYIYINIYINIYSLICLALLTFA